MKPGSRFPYVTTETPQMCFNFGFSDGKITLCLCRKSRTITRVLVTETRKPRVGPAVALEGEDGGELWGQGPRNEGGLSGVAKSSLGFLCYTIWKKLKEPFSQSYRC